LRVRVIGHEDDRIAQTHAKTRHPAISQTLKKRGVIRRLEESARARLCFGLRLSTAENPNGQCKSDERGRAANTRGPAEAGRYDSGLQIELKGNLAAMLSAAQNVTRSPESDDLSLQVSLVAGAGFEPAPLVMGEN
jgi:hypothetical protein